MVLVSEATRRHIVEQVRASQAIDGFYPSPEQEAGMELWIQGKITIDQLIEQAKERYNGSDKGDRVQL